MSEVKDLVSEVVIENEQLRGQLAAFQSLVREMAVIFQDDKGKVRIPGKIRKQAEGYTLDLRELKTSVVLTVRKVPTE